MAEYHSVVEQKEFSKIKLGEQKCFVWKNRRYEVGDTILFKEYNFEIGNFTGRTLLCEVTHIISEMKGFLAKNVSVCSIKICQTGN